MTTIDHPSTSIQRVPLRLRLSDSAHPLDGGWWPQSPFLAVELAQLVDQFPADRGRIVRAVCCPADWSDAPKRVSTARGYIEAGTFPPEDKHVVVLSTSDRHKLCLVVIPWDFTSRQGEAALAASVEPYFATSPSALLATIAEDPS